MALLPKPYPDEIVGSIMLRGRQQLGMPLKPFLSWIREVDGQSVSSFHLDSKVSRLAALCGCSPREFLYGHTVFPYAVAFMPIEQVKALEDKFLGAGDFEGNHASLIQNATYGSKNRRYCPRCAKEEQARLGETYWHRLHQLPGVTVCGQHQIALVQTKIRATVSSRPMELSMPPVTNFIMSAPRAGIDRANAFRLLETTCGVLEKPAQSRESTTRSRDEYRDAARARGYVRTAGDIAASAVATDLSKHFGSEVLTQLNCAVGPNAQSSWPALLLRPVQPGPAAPLRHILLRSFLDAQATSPCIKEPVRRKDYPQRDYAAMDLKASEMLATAIAQAGQGQSRLTAGELLRKVGIFGAFKHRRKNLPLCEAIIEEFLRSAHSARQVGGSQYWRERIPSRWGLESNRERRAKAKTESAEVCEVSRAEPERSRPHRCR